MHEPVAFGKLREHVFRFAHHGIDGGFLLFHWHGIDGWVRRAQVEPDELARIRNLLRAGDDLRVYLAEPRVGQNGRDGGSVAKGMASVDARAEKRRGGLIQPVKQRALLDGPPGGNRDPAAIRQHTTHLARRGFAVGDKLKHLLAQRHIERFVGQRHLLGGCFVPCNVRRNGPRFSDHERAGINALYMCMASGPLAHEACKDAGTAPHVEHALPALNRHAVEHVESPGFEDRRHENVFEDVCKTRCGEIGAGHVTTSLDFASYQNRYWSAPGRAPGLMIPALSLIHISEPTRQAEISYAVFCLKKKKSTTAPPASTASVRLKKRTAGA